ncbi:hypothetical protein D9758_012579 [Tetrapyrgos nigripes]|uniref:F-box domain-containing protein n=1 Tax=Tetrapyrgos nigripes TaxID=182062 RepID=A0A8H5FLF4_9AGAR|nr:hypothetical protein D9758_012579 [Tetrapyrgos nigripes]
MEPKQLLQMIDLSDRTERDAIRALIDEAAKSMHDLKAYRNSIASISYLPDELLSNIFYCCILETPWHLSNWSRILFGLSTSGTTRIFSQVFIRNLHRVKSLQLEGSLLGMKHFFEDDADLKALPLLRELRIRAHGNEARDWRLPDYIVEGGCPLLHSLSLNCATFSSVALQRIPNLTNLELHYISSLNQPLTITELLGLLQNSPQLERVVVNGSVDDITPNLYVGDPVPLPHLRRLALVSSASVLTAVISSIAIPPTTSLDLVIRQRDDPPTIPSLKSLVRAIRMHLHHSNSLILRSLFNVSRNLLDIIEFNKGYDKHHFYLFVESMDYSQPFVRSIITKILDVLPLRDIQRVNVPSCMNDELTKNTWRTVFERLPMRPLVIQTGISDTMMAMLEGLLDTMLAYSNVGTNTSLNKRRRREARKEVRRKETARSQSTVDPDDVAQAVGDCFRLVSDNISIATRSSGASPPSAASSSSGPGILRLELKPEHHSHQTFEEANRPEIPKEYFEQLLAFLLKYRDSDFVGKRSGARVPMLVVERYWQMRLYYEDQLHQVVDKVVANGSILRDA